jgi:fructose-1,6-bisphosphatase/inositol monophosphatase family enzyme
MTDLSALAEDVAVVAVDAGRVALKGIGDRHTSKSKGRFDIQLEVDLDAENAIIPRLRHSSRDRKYLPRRWPVLLTGKSRMYGSLIR